MQLSIDNRSDQPIYEQIALQIKAQIISGALAEDTLLPSIRSLAKDLRISVITTKRAYEELERAGFIYTVAAKGSFVARRNMELLREETLKDIEAHLKEALALAACAGLSREDVYKRQAACSPHVTAVRRSTRFQRRLRMRLQPTAT